MSVGVAVAVLTNLGSALVAWWVARRIHAGELRERDVELAHLRAMDAAGREQGRLLKEENALLAAQLRGWRSAQPRERRYRQ